MVVTRGKTKTPKPEWFTTWVISRNSSINNHHFSHFFWFYGPGKKEITIAAITPHP